MSAAHDLEAVIDALPADWCAVYLGMTSWVRARLGWRGLKADEYVDEGFAFLSTPDIKERIIDYRAVNRITEERFFESPEIALNVGDVLLTKDGSTIGIVHVVRSLPEPTTVNGSIAVITPSQYWEPIFLGYLLESWWAQSLMRGLQDGMGVPHLFQRDIKRMKLPCPPLETQQRIADYLEREIAEIDAAVADLDTHVELLKKRRRLVVTKAVAGDVGPGKGFSESWDQVPLRAVSADGGLFVDGDWVETKDQDPNGEIRLTQLADVGESVFLDKSDRWVNESKFEELGCTEVFPGDLLIARMPDPIARCTVMPDGLGYPAITVVDVAILRAGSDWNNRYVMWAINSQSFRNDVDSRVSGSTRQRISRSALGRTKLFRPPLEIQQQIADYLDRETAEIDSLIAESTKLRNLLLKRRSVLITEVVTGRKQV